MERKTGKKILFIVNPHSGGTEEKKLENIIERLSVEYKYRWDVYETSGGDDKKKIEQLLENYRPDMLIPAGGDGTVNLAASILAKKDISMGIIPLGSANGLAANLDIPNDAERALRKCLVNEAKPVDLIRINDKYNCIHLSDIGINARIVKRFEEEGSRGILGYGKQFFKELFSWGSAFRFRLSYNNSEKRMKAEMLVVANARKFGTGAVVNPKGELNDGKFEVIIFKPYPWWFVFPLFRAFITGNFNRMKYVNVLSLENAHVELHKPTEMQIDGEIMESMKSIDIKIIPGAVKIHY